MRLAACHKNQRITSYKVVKNCIPVENSYAKIMGGEWEKLKFSFFSSTFYNFLRLPVENKVLEHFVSLILRKREFFKVSVFNLV